jgi:sialic acid synthase SpsE
MIGEVAIGTRRIGRGQPCLVIAEAGVNHNGRLELALELVEVAAAVGADVVKFQMFVADELVAPGTATAAYQAAATGDRDQNAMLRRLQLTHDEFNVLHSRAEELDILFLASPFDTVSIDFLLSLRAPAIKLGSGELTNTSLLRHAAASSLPLILSTGMADLEEVRRAVAFLDDAASRLVLLHCVSEYPADPADANLRAMASMAAAVGVPVGFSDHTLGTAVSVAAVALGACVLEKHLTLDRSYAGPDHAASLDPLAFAELVRDVRSVESSLGDGVKRPTAGEREVALVVRRSLVAARSLVSGRSIAAGDLVVQRPGTGLAPDQLTDVIGRTLSCDVPAGTPLIDAMFS